VDNLGRTWAADTGYTGGAAWMGGGTINNTLSQSLYLSERYGTFSYEFAVPNGSYVITLKFAEMAYTQSGQRQYNISINGTRVATNFDIIALAGAAMKALDRSYPVSATGGTIKIEFSQGAAGAPMVNAIEVGRGSNGL
jgi:hypothetical protein